MKREYFAPKAELCEIQTVTMIMAGSGPVDPGTVEPGQEGGDMIRGRRGSWDNIWGN